MSEYRINITGDSTQFANVARGVIGKLNTVTRTALAGLGRTFLPFLTTGGLLTIGRNTMAWADHIKTLSDRTGIAVETIQELDWTARRTGTTVEAFITSIQQLARAQANAEAGSDRYIESFERLGISLDDLTALSPEQLFRRLSSSMRGADITAQRMADLMQLMGRRANELIPSMVTGFDSFADAARRAGTVIEEQIVDQLARANQEWDVLMTRAKSGAVPWVRRMLIAFDAFTTAEQFLFRTHIKRPVGDTIKAIREARQQFMDRWWPGETPTGTTGVPEVADQLVRETSAAAEARRARETRIDLDSMARAGLFTTTHQQLTLQQRSNQIQAQTLQTARDIRQRLEGVQRSIDSAF